MAVAYKSIATSDTGSTSAGSISVSLPGTVAAADVGLCVIVTERGSGVIPTTPTNWTALYSANYTSNDTTLVIAWIRLSTTDSGGVVTSTVTSNRRMSMAMATFSGSADPVLGGGPTYAVLTGSQTDSVGPSATPSTAASMLVGIFAGVTTIAPWTKTFTVTSPYTLRGQDQSTQASTSNAMVGIATQLLSGGAGTSQAGATYSADSTQYHAWPATVVLAPGGPTGNAGPDQSGIEPYSTVTLTATGTGTWTQTAGTTVTLSGTNPVTYVCPGTIAGETSTFAYGGDTMTVTSLPVTERMVRAGAEVALETIQITP